MKMLPRLQAEEQLAAIEAQRIGFGAYDPKAASEKVARLQQKVAGVDVVARPAKATPAQLGAVGIGLRQAPGEEVLSDG